MSPSTAYPAPLARSPPRGTTMRSAATGACRPTRGDQRRSGKAQKADEHRSDIPRLDQHAALHLHVHGVAEPGAVVPVDARPDRP